ncbi:hypothetical protein ACSMXN_19475 [Jatrophihabitans sp. DSM 45814]
MNAMIAALHAEHGDAATIVYQDSVRRGGVGGFFAREVHRIAYTVSASQSSSAAAGGFVEGPVGGSAEAVASGSALAGGQHGEAIWSPEDTADLGPLGQLLAAADAKEASERDDFAQVLNAALEDDASTADSATPIAPMHSAQVLRPAHSAVADRPAHAAPAHSADAPKVRRAGESLRTGSPAEPIRSRRAASVRTEVRARHRAEEPSEEAAAPVVDPTNLHSVAGLYTAASAPSQAPTSNAAPLRQAEKVRPLASVTTMPTSPARSRLDVLMQLREVGVPVSINPKIEAHTIFQAMDEVLSQLPPTPDLPSEPGQIIALVGELTPALRAAHTVAAALRLPRSDVWIAGINGHPAEDLASLDRADSSFTKTITGPAEARLLRSDLRTTLVPSIVVIATDAVEGDPADVWAAEVLESLQPDAAWLLVDASRKTADEHERLARFDGITALAVHSARLSSSPATVWDLGLPIALLDGRPATTFAWSSLLFSALPNTSRHQATA